VIEKMKYINIMGPVSDIDRVADQYLSRYEIQLEYTLKELATEKGISAFNEPNIYAPLLRKAERFVQMMDLPPEARREVTKEDAVRIVEDVTAYFEQVSHGLTRMKEEQNILREAASVFACCGEIDFQIENLADFKFIRYQFGRMPISSFRQFEAFLYKDPEILFVKGKSDAEYIWGIYFVPQSMQDKVDSVFSSLHFEKINLPLTVNGEMLKGEPDELLDMFRERLTKLDAEIDAYEKSMMVEADKNPEVPFTQQEIVGAYERLKVLSNCFDTRRFAARTENDFYIFVGWMTAKAEKRLSADMAGDENAVLIIEEHNEAIRSRPPTKLKNPWFVRPFEFFVRMYGLPAYDELDPTPFVAVTYTLLFGIMFSDVGQGLLLSLLGLLLRWKKKLRLGAVMCVIGLSSAVFGVLFGSVFGNEEIIKPLWMHPAENQNINNTLIYAIVFGVALIFVSMGFNVVNAIRKKRLLRMLLEPNGLAGIVFYATALASVVLVVTGRGMIAGWLIGLLIVLPLVLMMFREPLLNLLHRKRKLIHSSVALFLFESVIEMFEVLLGYFTNTVSFMRVGAFALSHASIMGVVWMLSETAGGAHNIAVIIFGNLLVIALEGLIAGIQVLRLQFYEMFSRFYDGSGREFKPHVRTNA